MMKATASKKELRHYFLQKRRALAAGQREAKSEAIIETVLAQPAYRAAKAVMAYAAMADEVQTWPLLERILADGKELYLPLITDAKHGLMAAAKVADLKMLQPDCYGILAPPADCATASRQTLDLVIVPGVAFTRQLYRLGMGGGFYDRFLPQLAHARRLGVFYDLQESAELPLDEYDSRLDLICTETDIYRPRQ